jgi:DNA-binding IclR family transcriptional regulator
MAEISRIGCAIEDEEGEIGCPCAGNPILDLTGGVIAAIAVAGTSAQIRLAIRNSSAGAPVFDHSGNVNTAISVAGTTAPIRSEEFTYFGQPGSTNRGRHFRGRWVSSRSRSNPQGE